MKEADADHQVLGELWDWLPDQIGQEVSVPLRVQKGFNGLFCKSLFIFPNRMLIGL